SSPTHLPHPLPPFHYHTSLPPPTSTLFPYTTLFRSKQLGAGLLTATTGVRADLAMLVHAGVLLTLLGTGPARRLARLEQCEKHRSEEHTSELQSRFDLVCRLLLEKKNICYHLKS